MTVLWKEKYLIEFSNFEVLKKIHCFKNLPDWLTEAKASDPKKKSPVGISKKADYAYCLISCVDV